MCYMCGAVSHASRDCPHGVVAHDCPHGDPRNHYGYDGPRPGDDGGYGGPPPDDGYGFDYDGGAAGGGGESRMTAEMLGVDDATFRLLMDLQVSGS
jgi:hypothetical protein